MNTEIITLINPSMKERSSSYIKWLINVEPIIHPTARLDYHVHKGDRKTPITTIIIIIIHPEFTLFNLFLTSSL